MAVVIQLKRGSQTQWATVNPVLAEGEIGFEKDTGRQKIGDGLTAWNDLNYFSSGSTFPIIQIANRPFELRKTVNLNDASKKFLIEINDVIVGSPSDGDFGFYQYKGGDTTDFENSYEQFIGI